LVLRHRRSSRPSPLKSVFAMSRLLLAQAGALGSQPSGAREIATTDDEAV
jgi:hypothetical protein